MMTKRLHLIPELDRGTWWILAGYTVSLFGTGMTEPYLISYLSQIRDMPLALAGMAIGSSGLAGAFAIPASGWLSDRLGRKRVFLSTVALNALGRVLFACSVNTETAFLAACISGAAAAGSWNILSVILAESVPPAKRTGIFGTAFALQNLGSGLGAVCGGVLIDPASVFSFQLIFFLDAVSFLAFALFGAHWIISDSRKVSVTDKSQAGHFSGTRHLLEDRNLSIIAFSYLIIAVIMTGLTTTLFPQWTTEYAHLSIHYIGYAFFVNCLVIVIGQILVPGITQKIRRTRVIAAASLFFAAGHLMIFTTAYIQETPAAIILISSLGVTAVGETLLFSTLPALVNDLATTCTRGRYNSVINASWQVGSILGPMLMGWGLSKHQPVLLFTLAWIGLIGFVPFMMILVKQWIPERMNKGKL